MRARIRAHWRPPETWRRLDPDSKQITTAIRTTLEIEIDRDGRLVTLSVVESSGTPAVDKVAVEAVERAQPFANPPLALVKFDGTIHFPFEFHFDVTGRRERPPARNAPLIGQMTTTPPEQKTFFDATWRQISFQWGTGPRWQYGLDQQATPPPWFAEFRLTIDQEGKVVDAKVLQSCGIDRLDERALATLREVSPLPKPPVALLDQAGLLSFDCGFIFNPDHEAAAVVLSGLFREQFAKDLRRRADAKWAAPSQTTGEAATTLTTVLRVHTTVLGALRAVELAGSSGEPAFDRSWMDAVRSAGPFRAIAKELAPVLADGVLVEFSRPSSDTPSARAP